MELPEKHFFSYVIYPQACQRAQWCCAFIDEGGALYDPLWFESETQAIAWAKAHNGDPADQRYAIVAKATRHR